MSEADFIVPIEDAVISEIRTNPPMCIGTFRTINRLYRDL